MAEHIGAREGAEEQHPPLQRVGDGDHRGGGADVSNDAEYLFLLVELLHGVGSARRLIAVVRRDQLQHPAFHTTGVVDPIERGIDPEFHLATELFGRAGERRRHSEPDFPIGDAADRRTNRSGGHWCGRRGSGGGGRRCDNRGQAWSGSGDGTFEVSELAVRRSAIHPSRRHGVSAVRNAAIQQLREVGALGLVGRGFGDHSRELVDDDLNAGTRDVPAGQCRTHDRADAACKVAHDVRLVTGCCTPGAREQGTGYNHPTKGHRTLRKTKVKLGIVVLSAS